MKIRKTALLAVLMLPLAAIPFRQANAASTLTIVESVPEETNYGSTLTQRPQKVWLDMINNAKKTLDFEQYYITDEEGEALSPVMNAIKKAIERGVKVRFLAGPSGSMVKDTMKPLNELKKVGAETRRIDFGKAYKGGVQHSKFFIVDGNAVYVGSQNFDLSAKTFEQVAFAEFADFRVNAVEVHVAFCFYQSFGVNVAGYCFSCTELQGGNEENARSCADIENRVASPDDFLKEGQSYLSAFVITSSERAGRVNVDRHSVVRDLFVFVPRSHDY